MKEEHVKYLNLRLTEKLKAFIYHKRWTEQAYNSPVASRLPSRLISSSTAKRFCWRPITDKLDSLLMVLIEVANMIVDQLNLVMICQLLYLSMSKVTK